MIQSFINHINLIFIIYLSFIALNRYLFLLWQKSPRPHPTHTLLILRTNLPSNHPPPTPYHPQHSSSSPAKVGFSNWNWTYHHPHPQAMHVLMLPILPNWAHWNPSLAGSRTSAMTLGTVTNLSALRVSLSPPSTKSLASTMATTMPFVELQFLLLSTTKTLVKGAGVSGLGFGGGWLFTVLLHIGAGAGAVGVVLSSMVTL
ncbi:hypothetical protein ACB098_10G065600 [Castanea mollissima]